MAFANVGLQESLVSIPAPSITALRALPSVLPILHLFGVIISTAGWPSLLKNLWRTISSPFRNFILLEDLLDPVDLRLRDTALQHRLLPLFSFVECAAWSGAVANAALKGDTASVIVHGAYLASWVYIGLALLAKPPLTPPYLFITFASILALDAAYNSTIAVFQEKVPSAGLLFLCLHLSFVWTAGTLPIKPYRPGLNVADECDTPSSKLSSPEDDVTLWSWSSFSFLGPLLDLASKQTLNEADVWTLSPFFLHKSLFNKYLEYRSQRPQHTLLRFLISSNSLDLIIDMGLELWGAVIGFVPAYSLQEILSALADNTPASRKRAFFFAFLTFLAQLSIAQVDIYQKWHSRRCYERTRGQLFCALHYKALKREDISGHVAKEGKEDGKAGLGKIVNLMQGDTYTVAQRFWEIAGFVSAPVRLTIAIVFLYSVLGWSAFVGVAIIAIAIGLNYPLQKYQVKIYKSIQIAKDKRMRLVNELLQNIRFLKFYGWEYEWSSKGQEAREKELRLQVENNVVFTASMFIWIWVPSATALACFVSYTLIAGEQLTVAKAFTTLALVNALQQPMTSLPDQILAMVQAYVSMQRIQAFFAETEVPEWASSLGGPAHARHTSEVGFAEATFDWESPHSGVGDANSETGSTAPQFQLGPLNVKFPVGELTIVGGSTGSGKSAVLQALLGEMHCLAGEVLIDKSNHQVAYCAQVPWLEHATIKDNIVFGSAAPFDDTRYHRVLYACALEQDLSILAAGDMTEIGEKGITLSGGQRARIALARALYSQAKTILLDDPLSAVDMHTAQHIVENCFQGSLAEGRTIILVTHHIGVCLPVASYLVELDGGLIRHEGTIEDLQARNLLQAIIRPLEEDVFPESTPQPEKTQQTDHSKGFGARGESQNGKLVEKEHKAEGNVTLATYRAYFKAAGFHWWVVIFGLQVATRLVMVLSQVFLAQWGNAYESASSDFTRLLPSRISQIEYPWSGLPSPDIDVKPWLLIYLYISAAGAFTILSGFVMIFYVRIRASRTLFNALLHRITRAPLRFFDTTPVGRILNRFTTDISTVDGALAWSARAFFEGVMQFAISFATILFIIPKFAPFALFIACLYIRLAPSFIKCARDLRRLESVALSPAFAGFDELLRGITHIRAFGMENRYQDSFYKKVDKFQGFDHVYWLVQNWLSWRYDCLAALVTFTATLFALFSGVADDWTAIVIVQAGAFASANRILVRVSAQLELDFNSVERIDEYLGVPQEAPAVIESYRPPAYWPSNVGSVEVEDLVVKYSPDLPDVLKGISFVINPGEKIGVVGRTGSGKSTLVLALLRMLEPTSGSIIIDGIDITKLGLEDLRTRLTIISQDVSLFSGTIRSNLDPLEKYTAEECETVIERCHLNSHFTHFAPTESEPTLLDMAVSANSMSAGEKQLLALARAILRGTNIIIMDEATSQIDVELDDKIQKTIREETSGAIVITIAHRLKTVIDYDRILVLDNGKIAEFDTPAALLKKNGGMFREICKKSSDWSAFSRLASSDESE